MGHPPGGVPVRVCGKCVRRMVEWLALVATTVAAGLYLDLRYLSTDPLPLPLRVLGVAVMLLMHYPLKRTGRLLRLHGECELWGWSTRLITWNVYSCVRHPHHVCIGVFMIGLGLAIGYPVTLLALVVTQWGWVVLFVLLVEERECKEKFGEEYAAYSQRVPMLLGSPLCILREALRGDEGGR